MPKCKLRRQPKSKGKRKRKKRSTSSSLSNKKPIRLTMSSLSRSNQFKSKLLKMRLPMINQYKRLRSNSLLKNSKSINLNNKCMLAMLRRVPTSRVKRNLRGLLVGSPLKRKNYLLKKKKKMLMRMESRRK